MTPQQRSLNDLRKQGWLVQTVESWVIFPKGYQCRACGQMPTQKVRRDLFGFADLFAVHPKHGCLLVQVTSGANAAARVAKILNDPKVAPLALKTLLAGVLIEVHSWALQGAKGERKLWKLRTQEIVESMFSPPSHALVAAENLEELPF